MAETVSVYGLDGEEKGKVEIPPVFSIEPRFDLIKRTVVSIEAAQKQKKGRDPLAGTRNTAESRGSGLALARVPRMQGSGFPTAHDAAFAPGVVRGRLAHPPTSKKITTKKINKKERRKGLLSAISATGNMEIVKKRGHKVDNLTALPLIIDDKIQTIKKTRNIYDILIQLGLEDELNRAKKGKTIRSGKRKNRGYKYKKRRSLLIVVKEDFGIYKAARNIPGIEIVNIKNLSCNDLAPGTHPGRLTLWTQSAFKELEDLDLF
jgi:large subunit ribosomal protein L4e